MTGKIHQAFSPCIDEKPDVFNHHVYLGFQSETRKWVRLLVNCSDVMVAHSGEPGFPKVLELLSDIDLVSDIDDAEVTHVLSSNAMQVIAGISQVAIIDDAARLDEMVNNEIREDKKVPAAIISRFMHAIQIVLQKASNICLAPALVYIDENSIQFGGAGLDGTGSPSLIAWMACLITGDTAFLAEDTYLNGFQRWEGRLPATWADPKVLQKSLAEQAEIVTAWLTSFQFSDTTGNGEIDLSRVYYDSVHHPLSRWGYVGTITLSVLEPTTFSPEQAKAILSWITNWTPDLLDFGLKQFLPGLSVSWYIELLDRLSNEDIDVNQIISTLPALCYSTIKNPPKSGDITPLYNRLLQRFNFSPAVTVWLENPVFSALNDLEPRERSNFLPIALIDRVIKGETEELPITLGLTCLVEANQHLGIEPHDICTWEILDSVIDAMNIPEGSNPSPEVISLVEDMHAMTKQFPMGANHVRSEKIANFIISHGWLLQPNIIHATGEMFDVLKKNALNNFPSNVPNPYLDFTEILVIHKTSTSDYLWMSLVDEWLKKYSDHALEHAVRSLQKK